MESKIVWHSLKKEGYPPLFDKGNGYFSSETQCGYIKQKHNRPVYRKGAKLHEAFKRIMRTREGFRK